MKSLLISLEGIEACGKSTLIEQLKKHLPKALGSNYQLHFFREPGSTELGEKLRHTLLGTPNLSPCAQTFLFLAARAQLIQEHLRPILSRPNQVIIMDRFLDSTLAYQGIIQGLGVEQLWALHQGPLLGLIPHRTYYLKLPFEVAMKRWQERGTSNAFEEKILNQQLQLSKAYDELSQLFHQRYCLLNADLTPNEVYAQCWQDLQLFFVPEK